MVRIGVLALQGDFREHIQVLQALGVDAQEMKLPSDLDGVDGLIIPGGESTTIGRLMGLFNLDDRVKEMVAGGRPLWGTCAGMIVIARHIIGVNEGHNQNPLNLIDIDVRRNAFGRQIDSFETALSIDGLGKKPFPAVFIRAPWIERVGEEVKVIAKLPDGTPVAARQEKVLVTSFHPELTQDNRFHAYFVNLTKAKRSV